MPLAFNWTLDVGQVLNIVSILGGGVWALVVFQAKLMLLHDRVGDMESEIKKLAEVVLSNARLDERVTSLSLRMSAAEARENARRDV